MSGTALALRCVIQHPLVASAVIGATSSRQLEELVAAAEQPPLDAELLQAIDAIHTRYPNPTP
jgi:aryl-alcohol dehydrogenase-like predicted oxidoreductase